MSKGGPREGSGRPMNSGKYREKTVAIRVPKSLLKKINKILDDFLIKVKRNERKKIYGNKNRNGVRKK